MTRAIRHSSCLPRAALEHGFTLVDVVVALAVTALIVPALVALTSLYTTEFTSGGFATVGGQQIPYAPSMAQQAVSEPLLTMFREDQLAAAQAIGVNAEVSSSYLGTSGVLTPALTASPTQLCNPASAYSVLSSGGVPFTANPGFSVFLLGPSAAIIAIYACNYQDSGGLRLYLVRRQGPQNQPLIAYSFVEASGLTQPVPGITLGSSSIDPVDYLVVRFPDPGDRLSDELLRLQTISNPTQLAAAQAAVRRSAQYVPYVQYRR